MRRQIILFAVRKLTNEIRKCVVARSLGTRRPTLPWPSGFLNCEDVKHYFTKGVFNG